MKTLFSFATAAFISAATTLPAEEARIWGSLGAQQSVNATEMQARYFAEPAFFGLQPVLGVSFASNNSAWVGVGSAYTWRSAPEGVFLRLTSMAGVHSRGNGRNLGGPIQFRTALDIGMALKNGAEIGIGADHRSSAGIYKPNPGLNTAYVFASMPLR